MVKIHDVFYRPYSKGRDWYDLLWYLTFEPRIEPNFEMLDNAFAQSGWTDPRPNPGNRAGFLKSAAEADLLTRSGFLSLLDIDGD